MLREAQIDALANYLVNGLITRGIIKARADVKDLVACVVELMSQNFETEARIDVAEDAAHVEGLGLMGVYPFEIVHGSIVADGATPVGWQRPP